MNTDGGSGSDPRERRDKKINNIWGNLAQQDGGGRREEAMDVDRRSISRRIQSAASSWQAQLEEDGMEEVMSSMSKNSMARTGLDPRGVENYLNRRVGPAQTRYATKRKYDDRERNLTGGESGSDGKKQTQEESVRVKATARRSLQKNPFGPKCDQQHDVKNKNKMPTEAPVSGNHDKMEDNQDKTAADSLKVPKNKTLVYQSDSDLSDGDLSDESFYYVKRQFTKKKLDFKRRCQLQKERESCTTTEKKATADEEATPHKRPKTEEAQPEIVDDTNANLAALPEPTERTKRREEYAKLTDEEFQNIMLRRLAEPKKFLIINAMKVFGRTICLEKFLKALKIWFYGGILQKNGKMIRTKGGTFMYLIKNDKAISESSKTEFQRLNEESEAEYRSKRPGILIKKEGQNVGASSAGNQPSFQEAVMARVNKSVVSKAGWNIDGKEFSAPTLAGRQEDARPKRAIVNYSEAEFLEDSVNYLFNDKDTLF